MRPRYPGPAPGRAPERWLMTDERLGAALWAALRRLPPGAGVVFRHHATPPAERRRMLRRVRRIAAARRLVLLVADGRDGSYGLAARRPRGAAAHDRREAIRAMRAGARLLFVSPVHPTRSHPGAAALGAMAAARIAGGAGAVRVALGGMDERRWRRLRALRLGAAGFDGWAGIDAWRD